MENKIDTSEKLTDILELSEEERVKKFQHDREIVLSHFSDLSRKWGRYIAGMQQLKMEGANWVLLITMDERLKFDTFPFQFSKRKI